MKLKRRSTIILAFIFLTEIFMMQIPARAAHMPSDGLAVITEDYEEEEYIIEEGAESELLEGVPEPYSAAVYSPRAEDFLYPRLSVEEKKVYAALWEGAQEPEKDAYVPFETYTCRAQDKASARMQDPMTSEERSRAACAVLFDHPEIYWSQSIRLMYSYVIKGDSYIVTVKAKFSAMPELNFSAGQAKLRNRAEALLSGIDRDASPAVVALKVHDALADNVKYDYDANNVYAHSAYGALVDGCAVCDGYAKAYKYLLGMCGIDASVVTSRIHAWNIVNFDGRYYETDVAWDDEEQCKDYYDVSTAQMDDGYYHERDTASTARYIPKAEGGKYSSQYMSFCGKCYENAGPTGEAAALSVIGGDRDSDLWTLDIIDARGTSLWHSVYKSGTSSDAFNIMKEFSRESRAEAQRIYGIKTGTYDIWTRIVYDNGAVSVLRTGISINGKVHTKSLSMEMKELAAERGEEELLKCRIIPEDSTDPVSWSSSDPETVSVDGSGRIRAVSKGAAVITVRSGECSASCKVTVNVTPTGLSVPEKMDLVKGHTAEIEERILPEGAEGKISWTSTDTKVAKVLSSGKIKALSPGTCTVTGKVEGTDIKAVCRITVLLPEPASQKTAVTREGIKLTWAKVPGASAYRIYRREEGGKWTARIVTAKQNWTDTSVRSGKKYAYAIACLSTDKKTEISAFGTDPVGTYYYTPVKVNLVNTDQGLKASWNALPGVRMYRLYYAAGSSWKKEGDIEGTSYTFQGLSSGTTRKVKVRALQDGALASGSSNTPSLKYIQAPDVKALTITGRTKIRITWNRSAGAAKYRIYCREGARGWKKLQDTTAFSYTWGAAKAGKTYTFRICCVSGNGRTITSAFGKEKSIKR